MIYIGYRIEDDVVYKTLNGEKFKLVSYYSDSTWRNVGRIAITIETDEQDRCTFDFKLEKDMDGWNERQEYKHLHYFMITCSTLSDNDVCIKNDHSKKAEDTWIPFLDWVDKLICPIREFMQKRDKEMEAMNNIDKDFSD